MFLPSPDHDDKHYIIRGGAKEAIENTLVGLMWWFPKSQRCTTQYS